MESINKVIKKSVDKVNPTERNDSKKLKKSISKNVKKTEENSVEPVESETQKSGFCYVGKINNKSATLL